VTQYTAQSLLQDARLQVEALGEGHGVMIVEGDSDKRLFAPRWAPASNVVVATNKTLVTGAHEAMLDRDRGRIVCLVDCDDDVARGTLRGAPDLIITIHADMEADLVAQGAIRAVVGQVVPDALSSDQRLEELTTTVLDRSRACVIPLGRLRRAARLAGIALEFQSWEFDYDRVRTRGTDVVDEVAIRAELQRRASLTTAQMGRIERNVATIRTDYSVCNGKDVIAACAAVLRADFQVPRRRLDNLDDMVRLGLGQTDFEAWGVVQRVRRWEASYGARLLSA
jgi:hypothetical protein